MLVTFIGLLFINENIENTIKKIYPKIVARYNNIICRVYFMEQIYWEVPFAWGYTRYVSWLLLKCLKRVY